METVNDIINEWRGIRPDCDECLSNHTCDYINRLIDRLDAANRLVIEFLESCIIERDECVARLTSENERLKAALKPVLDCITDGIVLTFDESSCAEGFDECMNAVNAVDEAKRIYNGGAK